MSLKSPRCEEKGNPKNPQSSGPNNVSETWLEAEARGMVMSPFCPSVRARIDCAGLALRLQTCCFA